MVVEPMTSLARTTPWKPGRAPCRCNHDARWLFAEIKAGRYPQQYRTVDDEYVLVCIHCNGLWDHAATDRVIDLVMAPK
jgi:hypothetical protein